MKKTLLTISLLLFSATAFAELDCTIKFKDQTAKSKLEVKFDTDNVIYLSGAVEKDGKRSFANVSRIKTKDSYYIELESYKNGQAIEADKQFPASHLNAAELNGTDVEISDSQAELKCKAI